MEHYCNYLATSNSYGHDQFIRSSEQRHAVKLDSNDYQIYPTVIAVDKETQDEFQALVNTSVSQLGQFKEAWDAERKHCDMTASVCYRVLKGSAYGGPLAFLNERVLDMPKLVTEQQREAMDHGNKCEEECRKKLNSQMPGSKLMKNENTGLGVGLLKIGMGSQKQYLMGFTPDDIGYRDGQSGRQFFLCEYKCPVSRVPSNHIPSHYYLQVQYEMILLKHLGYPFIKECFYAEFYTLTNEFYVWRVSRDDEIEDFLFPIIYEFIDAVRYFKMHLDEWGTFYGEHSRAHDRMKTATKRRIDELKFVPLSAYKGSEGGESLAEKSERRERGTLTQKTSPWFENWQMVALKRHIADINAIIDENHTEDIYEAMVELIRQNFMSILTNPERKKFCPKVSDATIENDGHEQGQGQAANCMVSRPDSLDSAQL